MLMLNRKRQRHDDDAELGWQRLFQELATHGFGSSSLPVSFASVA